MKILWFTNTPCSAADKLMPDQHVGGWLRSLEEQLISNENIELTVCFYWGEQLAPFKYNKTVYYPIFRKGSGTKFGRLTNRILNRAENDITDIQRLIQVIEAVEPDVIHVHGTEDNFGLIQRHTKIPVVISIQGILSPYSEKYFSGIPFSTAYWYEGLKQKLLFLSVQYLYNDLRKRAIRERAILSQAKYIIGRTDWDKRITRILSPNSQYFIGNEILRPAFYVKQWNKKQFSDSIQVVTVMSGGLYKGLETIVKTIKILCKVPEINFRWTIVGQNETGNLAEIIKKWLKVDYKLLPINFVGYKNETELVDILIGSDIYCQVSHIENSPNSVCEAMLVGIPIIASFAGGTDSILENGKGGVLVQDGDAYSYAGAIMEMANNYFNALDMVHIARVKAQERHSKEIILRNLISIYKTIHHAANNKKDI